MGISPLKKLGQNFQVDTHVVENVASHIPAGAGILEIGPGLGAWTEIFLRRGHRMVLVEKDRTLAARLKERFSQNSAVIVVEGDFLEANTATYPFDTVDAAVGNLPFYATSEILLRVIADMPQIKRALFGIQLEVAQRLAAGKGSSLAISLALRGKIATVGKISRSSFFPSPNVDAAVIAFERVETPLRPRLRLLLMAAFWGKRKALRTSLKQNPFWEKEAAATNWVGRLASPPKEIEALLSRRADDLTADEFAALYDWIAATS